MSRNTSVLVFAVTVVSLMLPALSARGQFPNPFNGDIDPFNKNNKLPFHIETPIRKPDFSRGDPSVSGLTVMSYEVDLDGYVWASSRSDKPLRKTATRAVLGHYPDGRAYWKWGDKIYPARSTYDAPGLRLDFARKQAAEQARKAEEAKQAAIWQQFVAVQNQLLQTPDFQLTAQLQNVPTEVLYKNLVGLEVAIREIRFRGTANPAGFEKLAMLTRGELIRRDLAGRTPPPPPAMIDLGTVQGLQRALAALGYNPGPADGIYGPQTIAAVIEFQTARGLVADGIVGDQTRASLRAALDARGVPHSG